jgi:uncharacterized repeat protein (TIGR01451 family)
MKKIITLFFFLFVCLFVHPQNSPIINIPDGTFMNTLLTQGVDLNEDLQIEQDEADLVAKISITWSTITSFEGIQYFKNIEELYLGSIKLESESLDLSSNTKLTKVTFQGDFGAYVGNEKVLKSINLSNLVNLNYLALNYVQLSSFSNTSLNSLTSLIYSNSKGISSLDLSNFPELIDLNCSRNDELEFLNLTNNLNLKTISCNRNSLKELNLNSNINLNTLDCSRNRLIELNLNSNVNLNTINCSQNQISSLNVNLCTELKKLDCSGNTISSINLGDSPVIEDFNCGNNKFDTIDVSKCLGLLYFYCNNNQLSNLYLSNNTGLTFLQCSNNQLTTLDLSNCRNLGSVTCEYNNLISLFLKNGHKENKSFNHNDNIKYLCVDEDEVEGLQEEVLRYYGYDINVTSYCSFKPGGTFYTIKGKINFTNGSCYIRDANNELVQQGSPVPFAKLLVTDVTNGVDNPGASSVIIADANGNYEIYVTAGKHKVEVINRRPDWFSVSPSSSTYTFPNPSGILIQERGYCFKSVAGVTAKKMNISIIPVGIARPGSDMLYKIVYKNVGPNTIANGFVELNFDDEKIDYVSSSEALFAQNTGNLQWSFSNLVPFEMREIMVTLNLNSPMETPALNSGDILTYTAIVAESLSTFNADTDDKVILENRVENAYDPNDKICLEGDDITPAVVGNYVNYRIRFENTGTADAINVVVKDIIDTTKFDISTLEIVDASHTVDTRITNTNKVELIFENINLPYNDANNDGYVVFKIETLPTLLVGDKLTNTANIYFDYNFPIETNEAVTEIKDATLGKPNFDLSNYFTLWPNPTNDVININISNALEIYSIDIYNLVGQQVRTIKNPTESIDVSGLKTGSYLLKINTNKGSSSNKVMKL